jgi:sigma-B regulation protein RsbU (phosphoserine phosphatase)
MRRTRSVILILFVLTALPLKAGMVTLGSADSYSVPFDIIVDKAGSLTFNDIKDSPKFMPTDRDAYGFINDVIWARVNVTIPEENTTEWFLEIGYPLLNKIEIYFPDDNQNYTAKKYGNKLPFGKRDIDHHNFLIRLNGNPGTYTYYLRFQTESSMNIPMAIHSLKNVISEINIQKSIFGLFYGALLILLAYNLLLAISMKDITYLFYDLFIVSLIFDSLQLNGYGFQYLWPNVIWMNNLVPFGLFLSNLTLTVFSVKYIDPRELSKFFLYPMYIYIGTIAVFLILSLFLPYHLMIMVGAAAFIPGITLVMTISAYFIRKKRREAYFYSLAWSFLFAGVIVTVGNRFGLLPNNPFTLWGFQIGTVISMSLFSLGLADRVNMLKNNFEEINIHLEEKVDERTKELQHAKDEVEAAMEELEAINERLTHTNQELEEVQGVYRKDMSMAANLQLSLLPKEPPLAKLYDIDITYIPKAGVSGDFYDFFVENNNFLGAGIFDVSGHGIAPGLITLMAKSIISATFLENKEKNLGTVLEKINNKLISEIKDIDSYLTGILLRFKDDMIEYINCAHPDLICKKIEFNRTGKVLDKSGERISGPFLGIDPRASQSNYSFKEITFKIKPGDCLLLFTDSLTESVSAGGDEYGETRIMKSLNNASAGTAHEILSQVMSDFFNFLGAEALHDDLTVMLIRRK